VSLADLKESFPLELAEYAVNNKLVEEPAFAWWVGHFLKLKERTISKVLSRRQKQKKFSLSNFKFGVKVPRNVKHAYEIDKENGNTMWRDAILKEMKNVREAFKVLHGEEKPPPGFQEIKCHLIFDVKSTLQRKARFVAGGHLMDAPKGTTYSSVVSRESIRLFFLIAALNGLDVLVCDI